MSRLPRSAVIGTIALATVAAMGSSLRNGFVYDDVPIIVQDHRVTDPHLWHQIPSATYWLATLWRPLTVMGFALQWWAGEGHAWVFHAVSLVLYAACGWLLFALLTDLAVTPPVALLAVAAFLVHPVHVEAVANGVGQAELWATLALIAATRLYIRMRRLPPPSWQLPALLLLVTAAIMGKEQGFVAVILLAGVEWLILGKEGERIADRIRYLVPVAALSALLLLVRSNITGGWAGESPAPPLATLGFGGRATTFLGVVPEYARLLFWPLHLSADYNPPQTPVDGPLAVRHLIGAILVAVTIAAFLLTRRRNPAAAFGLWWMAVTLAPVSNLLTASGIVMAERVLLLPSAGLVIALAAAASPIAAAARHRTLVGIATAVCALWIGAAAVRSTLRVPVWRDQASFMTHLAADAPRSYRAAMVIGSYWKTEHQPVQAEQELRRSLSLWPGDVRAHIILGNLLLEQKRCPEAIPVFMGGLLENPDDPTLRSGLVQCQIAVHDWPNAERTARIGIGLGQTALQHALDSIHRAEGVHP